MSEEIGHLFMDWYSEFLWVIFYVSEKIGHLFIVDWQSFLCEANLFFLRAGENEAVVHGTAFVGGNSIGQVFMD